MALHWQWPLGDEGFDSTVITTVSWFCPGSHRQLPWCDSQETLKAHVPEAGYFVWLKCGWHQCEPHRVHWSPSQGSRRGVWAEFSIRGKRACFAVTFVSYQDLTHCRIDISAEGGMSDGRQERVTAPQWGTKSSSSNISHRLDYQCHSGNVKQSTVQETKF